MEKNSRQIIIASLLGVLVGAIVGYGLVNPSATVVSQTADNSDYQQLRIAIYDIRGVLKRLEADFSSIASSASVASDPSNDNRQLIALIRDEVIQAVKSAKHQGENSSQNVQAAVLDDHPGQNVDEDEEVVHRIIDSFSNGAPLYNSLPELMSSQEMRDLSMQNQKQVMSAVVMMLNRGEISEASFFGNDLPITNNQGEINGVRLD